MLAEELGSHQPQTRPGDTFLDECCCNDFFLVLSFCVIDNKKWHNQWSFQCSGVNRKRKLWKCVSKLQKPNLVCKMGQTLSEPITAKESSALQNANLKVGSSSMQGWRITMEDAHTLTTRLCGHWKKAKRYFAIWAQPTNSSLKGQLWASHHLFTKAQRRAAKINPIAVRCSVKLFSI